VSDAAILMQHEICTIYYLLSGTWVIGMYTHTSSENTLLDRRYIPFVKLKIR